MNMKRTTYLVFGWILFSVIALQGCGFWAKMESKWDEWEKSSPEYQRRQAEIARKEQLAQQKWTLDLTVCRMLDIGLWDPELVGLPPVAPYVLRRSFSGTREQRRWARELWDTIDRIPVDSLRVQLVYEGEEGLSPEKYTGPIQYTNAKGKVIFSDVPGGYFAHMPNAYLILIWSGQHPDLELLETVERVHRRAFYEPRDRPKAVPFVLPAVAASRSDRSVALGLLISYGYRVPVYLKE